MIFPSPANGATVASPVEIVYAHNPACEDDHPAYDTPYGQNMLPPQVVNVATGKNEMELSPGIGRRIVASPSLVGLDSVYVTAFEYGASSAIPRQGVQRTERIVMGLPNGTYEVKFTLFVPCAGSSAVLRFTVGAAAAPAAPRSLPRTLLEALSVLNDPNASPEARAAAERIVDAASGRTEDFTAEAVISVWPTGRLSAAALEALPWFKRFSEAFGAQLGVLLRKHLPQIKGGSAAALARFRLELAGLIPRAVARLPETARRKAIEAHPGRRRRAASEGPERPHRATREDHPEARRQVCRPVRERGPHRGRPRRVDGPLQAAEVGGTRQGNGETYQQLSKLLGGGYVGLKNKPGLSGPGGSVSVGPSVDVKIAGVPVRKIKPATHKTKK